MNSNNQHTKSDCGNYPTPATLPKEATLMAKELVEKFKTLTMVWDVRKEQWAYNLQSAKQCALICADEILKIQPLRSTIMAAKIDGYSAQDTVEYWQQVRTAINQL